MTPPAHQAERGGWARWTVWVAGLVVALGAGVATAHGLYQVALAAGTPRALAWLYPLITDGLALVAYATTARLANHGRTYAWTVVVTAAGLSGLTQASYLAGGVASAPPALRFAIGAWPAIAAAIVAHLLFLLGTDTHPSRRPAVTPGAPPPPPPPVAAAPADPAPPALPVPHSAPFPVLTRPTAAGPTPLPAAAADPAVPAAAPRATRPPVQPVVQRGPVRPPFPSNAPPNEQAAEHPDAPTSAPVVRAPTPRATVPARIRAQTAATGHATRHGHLPTVSELMALAQVARGTAAAALKDLRHKPAHLHVARTTDEPRSHQ